MTSRRFFAVVWRINAIVLLVVGILGAVALSAAVFFVVKDATRTRYADDVARVAVGDDVQSQATLGHFEALPRSAVLRAPLRVTQSYSIGSGSKEASSVRNYLFYDPASRQTRWLKSSMDSLIVQTWRVPEGDSYDKPDFWVASVYAIATSDTNRDGVLNESDQVQIASSLPDGTAFRLLVERADRLNEARLLSTDRVLVLYSLGSKLHAVEFNPRQSGSPAEQYEVKLPAAAK
jgi:hypothetical protein